MATDIQDIPLAELYFFGVIDVLTIYTSSKRMETFVKSFYQNSKTISAVDPDYYASRFLEFIAKSVVVKSGEEPNKPVPLSQTEL